MSLLGWEIRIRGKVKQTYNNINISISIQDVVKHYASPIPTAHPAPKHITWMVS